MYKGDLFLSEAFIAAYVLVSADLLGIHEAVHRKLGRSCGYSVGVLAYFAL